MSVIANPQLDPVRAGRRFDVLDGIRGIAAFFVLISHCGNPPLFGWVTREMPFWYPVKAIYGNLIPGPPAVVVFFVLSGFCIHYPHRKLVSLDVASFLTRRYLRVCIPMVVAIGISIPMQVNLSVFRSSVLWSLVAELIYYTGYPWIRRVTPKIGWTGLLGISFVAAAVALAQFPRSPDFTPFGNTWNWILCLPSWLLGCILAEDRSIESAATAAPRTRLYFLRLAVWAWATVASALRFHSAVGYPWTLFFFGVPIFFWLREELKNTPSSWIAKPLEWAGQWSYSLYLVHMLGIALVASLGFTSLRPFPRWGIEISIILGFAYLFFLLVELPSHWLSRRAAAWVQARLSKA